MDLIGNSLTVLQRSRKEFVVEAPSAALPPAWVDEVLARHGRESSRRRKLPAPFVVWFVILMGCSGEPPTPISWRSSARAGGRRRAGARVLHRLRRSRRPGIVLASSRCVISTNTARHSGLPGAQAWSYTVCASSRSMGRLSRFRTPPRIGSTSGNPERREERRRTLNCVEWA